MEIGLSLRRAALPLLACSCLAVHAQTCTVSGSASVDVPDILSGSSYDIQGSVTFSCTRPKGNPRFPSTFWIGVSGNGTRTMDNGSNSLVYTLTTDYSSCSTTWQNPTGLTLANSLTANNDRNLTNLTVPFCIRVATATQPTAKPLVYTDALTLRVRSTNSSGTQWGTGTLSLSADVDPLCRFSSAANPITMAYTSFQAGAASGSSSFQLQCTNSTPYSVALDAVTATVMGLNMTAGIGTLGTQNVSGQVGTGLAQSYTVVTNIAGGQSGTCASGAGCSASGDRTVTVSY